MPTTPSVATTASLLQAQVCHQWQQQEAISRRCHIIVVPAAVLAAVRFASHSAIGCVTATTSCLTTSRSVEILGREQSQVCRVCQAMRAIDRECRASIRAREPPLRLRAVRRSTDASPRTQAQACCHGEYRHTIAVDGQARGLSNCHRLTLSRPTLLACCHDDKHHHNNDDNH